MRPDLTAEQFFDVFRRYHEATWPSVVVLWVVGCTVAVLALTSPRYSRILIGALAMLWAWMGVVYHILFFAPVNGAAYAFGGAFVLNAIVLAWLGSTGRLKIATRHDRASSFIGGVLVVYALVGYPLVAYVVGQRYPSMSTFGLPCPTTIFTLGLLSWCERPIPRIALVVPALWALIGTSGAVMFDVPEDVGLIVSALVVIPFLTRARRTPVLPVLVSRP